MQQFKAIVTFSGGQDSTTVLAHAVQTHGADAIHAMTANYGQRHRREIEAAKQVCNMLGVRSHEIVHLTDVLWGTSPLTNVTQELETYESPEQMEQIIGDRREKTFVPMRNPLFLIIAANRAAVYGAELIYTGICQMDNANYDDCRDVFLQSLAEMTSYALGSDHRADVKAIEYHAPLLFKSKPESVEWALRIRGAYVALGFSHTAYSGEYPPVTQDHATVLREAGFAEADVADPLILRAVYEGLIEMPPFGRYQRFADIIDMNRKRGSPAIEMLESVLSILREERGITGPEAVA